MPPLGPRAAGAKSILSAQRKRFLFDLDLGLRCEVGGSGYSVPPESFAVCRLDADPVAVSFGIVSFFGTVACTRAGLRVSPIVADAAERQSAAAALKRTRLIAGYSRRVVSAGEPRR